MIDPARGYHAHSLLRGDRPRCSWDALGGRTLDISVPRICFIYVYTITSASRTLDPYMYMLVVHSSFTLLWQCTRSLHQHRAAALQHRCKCERGTCLPRRTGSEDVSLGLGKLKIGLTSEYTSFIGAKSRLRLVKKMLTLRTWLKLEPDAFSTISRFFNAARCLIDDQSASLANFLGTYSLALNAALDELHIASDTWQG